MKYYVERHHSSYGVGKCGPFATKEDAEKHINSDDCQMDMEEGFWFKIIEEED